MTKITQYRWHRPNVGTEYCEYHYEDGVVYITRNGVNPPQEKIDEVRTGGDGALDDVFHENWIHPRLLQKDPEKLFAANKRVLEFLNARLGD